MTGSSVDGGTARSSNKCPHPKKKKDQLSLAQYRDNLAATDPILTAPGGWGLRNPEPKGPGQRKVFFSQFSRAVAGRKWGGIMIPLTIP
jgi:hypothetical protein